jgi:hypothetical protein
MLRDLLTQKCLQFFLPALVRTYNVGQSFALLLLFLGRTHCSKYCIIVQFHHAFSILHHCMHLCPAALPGSLARQSCPAVLPGSFARQPCPSDLPGRLARQPCSVAFAWQPCPVALPASLARQPCPPDVQKSLQAVLRP